MNKLSISIVILTKNAGSGLEKTLNSVCNQSIDSPYEIVIVDSGSTDETLSIANSYKVIIHKINSYEFNFGLTRNYAFSLTSGDILVTISQDVVPCNISWLRSIVYPFYENNKVAAVQGSTVSQDKTDVFYWEKEGYFYFTSESKKWIEKHKYGLSFVNCAIRKKFWEKHQMGSMLFSEDKFFQKMIYESGMEIYFAEDAVCYHGHQYTLKSLINRLKNEGIGWKYVDVCYGLNDCIRDIYNNKWLIRKGFSSWMNGEIDTIQELLFPILRPVCIYYGNSRKI